MDLKKYFSKDKNSADLKKIISKIGSVWMRHQQIFFIGLVFIAGGIGGFFWYKSLNQAGWTEEKKREYSATQSREINSKETEFKNVIAEIENRKKEFDTSVSPTKNIFRPY